PYGIAARRKPTCMSCRLCGSGIHGLHGLQSLPRSLFSSESLGQRARALLRQRIQYWVSTTCNATEMFRCSLLKTKLTTLDSFHNSRTQANLLKTVSTTIWSTVNKVR